MIGTSIWDPLSDEELDELEDFLASTAVPEGAMSLFMLDGFLTALAVGPCVVLPDEWLPQVWGCGQSPVFSSMEEAQRAMELMLRQLSGIIGQLQEAPDQFEPMLSEQRVEGRTFLVADEWAHGFMRAVDMRAQDWAPMFENVGTELLMPVLMFATQDGWERINAASSPEDEHEHWISLLGPSVCDIQRFWCSFKESPAAQASAAERAMPQPGDPCPCGSGQRFRLCCGAPGRLH